jgi:hypothetical protein
VDFPFWQVFGFAAPALMGEAMPPCKHAPNVPGCALAIEQVFGTQASGRPLSRCSSRCRSKRVIRHRHVAADAHREYRRWQGGGEGRGARLKKCVLSSWAEVIRT